MRTRAVLSFDTPNMALFIKELLTMKSGVWKHSTVMQDVIISCSGDIEQVRQEVISFLEQITSNVKPS